MSGAALIPELTSQEHTYASDSLTGRYPGREGQALPGLAFTDFSRLQVDRRRFRRSPVAVPRLIPGATAGDKGRYCNQLYALVVELEVVFRVPAVVTDQYAQPYCGGINIR